MDTKFIFQKHDFSPEEGSAIFFYELQTPKQTYNFTETLLFPFDFAQGRRPATIREGLTPFLDALLLILGISYWKTFCPKNIETPTIQLTKEQADFWNTVYTKGLGEFFYKNKIDYRNLVQFPYVKGPEKPQASEEPKGESESRSLLLFGGGKDSIVSAELLKKAGKQFTLLQVNTSDVQEETAKIVSVERIIVKRVLDPKLFELNKKSGIYNGHIPITAIWEFIGLFAAALNDYSYVISSNEKSANYGNVEYLGNEINHQWSKSLEFEKLFQEYSKKYISPTIISLSILRQFDELQITKEFVKYPQYFPYFSSCNSNFKLALAKGERVKWCGECPKCLFVFIMLSAYLKKDTVLSIFGENLLSNSLLIPIFKKLVGVEKNKPFDCVGTPEEVRSALYLIYKKGEYNSDSLMKFFKEKILPYENF